jgi:hypothetical protein
MGESRYSSTFLDLGIRWRWVVSYIPLPLYNPSPGKESLVPIGQLAGWAPESVWMLRAREKSCTVRNQTCVIQPIARHYTNWASPTLMFGKEYKLWSFTLSNFPQPPIITSILGPNILISSLLSNTFGLCSFLNAIDKASHPHKTTS